MKQIDERIERNLLSEGYVRMNDTEAGAWFCRGTDSVHISGHMVLVRSNGMTKSFPEDKARMLGIRIMERLARKLPRPVSGKEDRTNYDIRQARLPV